MQEFNVTQIAKRNRATDLVGLAGYPRKNFCSNRRQVLQKKLPVAFGRIALSARPAQRFERQNFGGRINLQCQNRRVIDRYFSKTFCGELSH